MSKLDVKTVPISTLTTGECWQSGGLYYMKVSVPASLITQAVVLKGATVGNVTEVQGTEQVVPVNFKPLETA